MIHESSYDKGYQAGMRDDYTNYHRHSHSSGSGIGTGVAIGAGVVGLGFLLGALLLDDSGVTPAELARQTNNTSESLDRKLYV